MLPSVRPGDRPIVDGTSGEIAVRPGEDTLAGYAIPGLKQALAGARLYPMRRAMEGLLALSDAHSVAAALREALLS